MPVTFEVNDIVPEKKSLSLRTSDASEFFNSREYELLCPDSHSPHQPFVVESMHKNKFISAILIAFNHHLPLSLRPQHFWLLILQAVMNHVHHNSEQLRTRFVSHQGQEEIKLERHEFQPGVAGNDWNAVIDHFSSEISKRTVSGTHQALSPNFSNTTKAERLATEVTIMGLLKDYFSYVLASKCGFPRITLEGSMDDWRSLRNDAENLIRNYCLAELSTRWLPAILSVLDRFILTFENPEKIDVSFWESMCKKLGSRGSGTFSELSGWINVFFPVQRGPRKTQVPNPYCVPFNPSTVTKERGMRLDLVPIGVGAAPVTWKFLTSEMKAEFRAGFLGVSQDADGTIKPEIGMYIVNLSKKREFERKQEVRRRAKKMKTNSRRAQEPSTKS